MDIKKCATSDIKVAKSEKCPCANCRKPVSIMGHNQLKNGKGLCKECLSKTTPLFNCSQSTLDDYKISIRQLRDSEVLYFKYFKGNSSSRTILKTGIFGVTIEINSNVALMGVTVCASGFAALTKKYHLVFRVADFKRASKLSEKNHVLFNESAKTYAQISMANSDGVNSLVFPCSLVKIIKFRREMDKIFGLTGLRGIKEAFNNARVQAVGYVDNPNDVSSSKNNKSTIGSTDSDSSFYKGREELIRRADIAIKETLS